MKKALLVLVILIGCDRSDPAENFESVYDVPEDIQPLVELFREEGELRGRSLVIENLIIEMSSSLPETTCGRCIEENGQRIIYINNSSRLCWNTPEQFEALIFHELGHCVLNRGHDETLLPNGDPKSLMTPHNTNLYSSCPYDVSLSDDCDQTYRREYYMEELFNEETSAPYWSFFE